MTTSTLLALLTTLLAITLAAPSHATTISQFPPSVPPTPEWHPVPQPLLSTVHYPASQYDLQPGRLNYYNFSRPEGTREFYLYVPTAYSNKSAWPFTFYFHGYTSDYRQGINLNMTVDAEAAGYLIAFGQGTPASTGPKVLGWNGGECCLFNDSTKVDDVEFMRVALRMIRAAANIDSTRIYATGWSNGAFMTERLACETGTLFAGIAADAGMVGVLPGGQAALAYCDKVFGANYTNIIHLHGTADPTVMWTGAADDSTGFLHAVPSALDDLARWAQRMKCGPRFSQTYNDGTFSNLLWPDCREGRELEFMTVRNGVHAWWTKQQGGFETMKYVLAFFDRTHKKQHAQRVASE